MTAPASLSAELREHIIRVYTDTPVAERRASHWVMDPEWINDVRRIDDDHRRSVFGLLPLPGQPERIYGLPLELRNGAGPPHLEPAP